MKKIYIILLLVFIIISSTIGLFIWKERYIKALGITTTSLFQIYEIPTREKEFLIKVTDNGVDKMSFVHRTGIKLQITPLIKGEEGLYKIDNIEFHTWNNKGFVEIANSTDKGNGVIFLYLIEGNQIRKVLIAQNAVDRNLDTTANTVYENGMLNIQFEGEKSEQDMPDVILSGTELIYGYAVPEDFTGEELLFQRNAVHYTYKWNKETKMYEKCEYKKELLQQVEGVYPIIWKED